MAHVVICETCKGNKKGEIYKEVKPGVWKWVKCPAGCNKGRINKKLI